MYKCTDCNQEYDIKPEYCECGNNTFDFIDKKPVQQVQTAKQPQAQSQPQHQSEPVINPQKQETKRHTSRFDVPSLIIFFVCIILSILSIIFIGKDNNEPIKQTVENTKTKTENIPSFDKIWKEPQEVSPQKEQRPKEVQKTPAPQPVKQTCQNVTQKNVKQKAPKKTQSVVNTKTTPQNVVKKETQNKSTKKDSALIQKELITYKLALRDKIGTSIDFARVVGDGNCTISFKVDATGNLVNRNFSIQSPNNSLNDAVYSAMMRNPTFSPPPSGYKGETLTLNVKIYGGDFEVSLK